MAARKVHLIAAARPNFMKVAPLWHALRASGDYAPVLIHTGQHYDPNMSAAVFADLRLPDPDFHLGIGSGSHAEQTGKVLIAYGEIAESAPAGLAGGGRRRQFHASPARSPAPSSAFPPSIWKRACARATGACPRS